MKRETHTDQQQTGHELTFKGNGRKDKKGQKRTSRKGETETDKQLMGHELSLKGNEKKDRNGQKGTSRK